MARRPWGALRVFRLTISIVAAVALLGTVVTSPRTPEEWRAQHGAIWLAISVLMFSALHEMWSHED